MKQYLVALYLGTFQFVYSVSINVLSGRAQNLVMRILANYPKPFNDIKYGSCEKQISSWNA